jgi:pimeloyl-ACP methyl ester carboxylesterase
MIERTLSCLGPHGFHRVFYREWPGPRGAPTLLCVHGLARNSRDFEAVAEEFSARYRVVCPDVAGRGRSDYLAVPADYDFPLYIADMAALIARLDVESVDWIGTSMGGLIGLLMAAQPGNPIRRLALNDVGAFVPKAPLERIAAYVGMDPTFPSIEAVETIMRRVLALGALTDAQWRRVAEVSSRAKPGGGFSFDFDPHIADVFKLTPPVDVDLWPVWNTITCPVLVLRGAVSDILPRAVADEMTRRGPKAKLVEFAGIGHAPPLLSEDQIGPVRDFLLA